MMAIFLVVAGLLLAYLLGSISFAVVVSAFMKMDDPRTYGSGNPGATNVLRSGKKLAAALTLLGDALKGYVAVVLFLHVLLPLSADTSLDIWVGWVAVAALVGHMWPVFFGFKGGKGVATALGVLAALSIYTALVLVAVWLILVFVFRISSLAALISAMLAAPVAYFFMPHGAWVAAALVISLLVLYRHKSNIKKLISGEESKIGDKAN